MTGAERRHRLRDGDGPFPCAGRTYLSSGMSGDDGPWEQVAECDDIGGCGWRVVLSAYTGTYAPEGSWDVTITSDEFLPLHEQHLDHRSAARLPGSGAAELHGNGDSQTDEEPVTCGLCGLREPQSGHTACRTCA